MSVVGGDLRLSPTLESYDIAWVLLCAALVFVMQAGFCCLERGLSRTKNNIDVVAIEPLLGFAISSSMFWLVGFAMTFGPSWHGIVGGGGIAFDATDPGSLTFFVFQLMLCATCAAIVSGAVAERMTFPGYLVVTALVAALIYPVVGHWMWARPDFGLAGWLATLGFIDFAGSTVVHSTGAWVALAAVLAIGPRLGRGASERPGRGHDMPMVMLGVLLLWFGWFGFNGGSTLGVTAAIPMILVNTALAGAFGAVGALGLSWYLRGRADVLFTMKGSLAGLVAIAAGADVLTPPTAALIGVVAGMATVLSSQRFERLGVGDVVGVVSIHGVAGVWGTLAVALFADLAVFGDGASRGHQVLVQLAGIGSCFAWSFGTAWLALSVLARWLPLRARAAEEIVGQNVADHARTQPPDLARAMEWQSATGDFREDVAEALGASEERMRLIVESALDAVITMDVEGRITSWNKRATSMFGRGPDEVMGCDLGETILPAGDREEHVRILETYRSTGGGRASNRNIEFTALHRDGREFPIELAIAPVKAQNGVLFSAFIRDVSERTHSREELVRAKDAAEALARTKSEFLANMSHEIRTPMNGVIGMTGLLLDTTLSADQRDYVETIRSSGDALLTIINDILDFSKIDARKLDLEEQPFEISVCVTEALGLLASSAEEKGLELRFASDDDVPLVVRGDVDRLRQILVNLLSNAIKFTETGEVVVRVSKPGGDGGADEIQFSVRDTGIGIPGDRMDRLFQSFQQVDASTTRRYGGTGLGLTISKRLAEMMGGTMWVDSVEGEGSTFHFTIPLPAAEAGPQTLEGAGALAGRRVLVVDDNRANRTILMRQASSWGLTPLTAVSGPEALAMLDAGERFDFAVLDLLMPEMNGIELAREIRGRPQTAGMPLVLLSSVGSSDIAGLSADSAVTGTGPFAEILTKPARPERLLEVLTRIARGVTAPVLVRPTSDEIDGSLAARVPLRILLAEDNRINQKVALRMLEQMGYRSDVAGNGLEVLAALERQPYDVVLMDVQMPDMDGLQATRRVRSDWEADEQPRIIALTANAMRSDRAACRDAGMDDYIAKPLTPQALADALARCGRPTEAPEFAESRGLA